MSNPINKPAHYAEGRKHEPIDVIEDWGLGFNLGNCLKYVSRAGRKGDAVEDLKKARWYLEREIGRLEANSGVNLATTTTTTSTGYIAADEDIARCSAEYKAGGSGRVMCQGCHRVLDVRHLLQHKDGGLFCPKCADECERISRLIADQKEKRGG